MIFLHISPYTETTARMEFAFTGGCSAGLRLYVETIMVASSIWGGCDKQYNDRDVKHNGKVYGKVTFYSFEVRRCDVPTLRYILRNVVVLVDYEVSESAFITAKE